MVGPRISLSQVSRDAVQVHLPLLKLPPNRLEIHYGEQLIGAVDIPPAVSEQGGNVTVKLHTKLAAEAYAPILGHALYRVLFGEDSVEVLLDENSATLLRDLTKKPKWTPEDLILGDGDIIFFRNGTNKLIDVHQGRIQLTERQRERWAGNLSLRAGFSQDSGIPCLTAIIPNKETIYHRLIPGIALSPDRPARQLRTLAEAAGAAGYFHEMEDDLLAHAEDFRLFNKTNPYWTAWGAGLGFNSLVPLLHRHGFVEISPFEPAEFMAREGSMITDWGMAFRPPIFDNRCVPELRERVSRTVYDNGIHNRGHLRIHRNTARAGTVLLFCDSYTLNVLWQFFAERFGTVILARHAAFDAELVRMLAPDLVMNIMIERFLIYPPNDEADLSFSRIAEELGKGSADDWSKVRAILGKS